MSQTITPELPDTGAARIGGPDCVLGEDEVRAFVREQLDRIDLDGASVCLLVPDGTRSCPLPIVLPAVHGALRPRKPADRARRAWHNAIAAGCDMFLFFNVMEPLAP